MTLSEKEIDELVFYATNIREVKSKRGFDCRVHGAIKEFVVDETFFVPGTCGGDIRVELARQLKLRINGTTEPELYEWI